MEIYVVRHGETNWNKLGITQGRSQNRLNKTGIEQITKTADKLKDKNFDYIFCSPLMRTVQSAKIINRFHNKKIIKDARLNEIDQGIFSGTKFCNLNELQKQQKFSRSSELGMESFDSVESRVADFVEEAREVFKDKKILLVTHDIVAAAVEAHLNNIKFSEENYKNMHVLKNAEYKKFEV